MYALMVLSDRNFALEAYAKSLKLNALSARTNCQSKIENANLIINRVCAKYQNTMEHTAAVHGRMRNLRRGTPSTEFQEAFQPEDMLGNNLSDAEKFLLKKSYRQAARLSHPDRGGSTEEFQAVSAAYKAKDLSSIIEYVLTREKGALDKINYWKDQVLKANVDWVRFQSTNCFVIARLYMQGYTEQADLAAQALVSAALQAALEEERDLLMSLNSISNLNNLSNQGTQNDFHQETSYP